MRRRPTVAALIGALALLGSTYAVVAQDTGDEPGENAEQSAPDPQAAYRTAASTVDDDLAAVLEELATLRKEIAAEKPAVARETRELAAELRDKRRRAELARQDRDALVHELQVLSDRVRLWRDESVYIESLLADFTKQNEAAASVAAYQSLIDGGSDENSEGRALDLAAAAFTDIASVQRQGGRIIAGQALDADGVARDGDFVEIGPVSWFIEKNGDLAGLVMEGRDLRPEVVAGTGGAEELRTLAAGGAATPAFDPTLGAALALNEAEGGFVEHIRQGGLWIYPILLLALIAIVVAVMKWLQISRIREVPPAVVRRVIDAVNAGDHSAANAAVDELSHPAAELLRRGIAISGQERDLIEEAVYEEFVAAQPPLKRGLPLIAIASATAPLLGLLGTVTGMIGTFHRIKIFGTSDTNVIAGGISEALVTTEFGLAVAIPALIVHALLSRRIQGMRSAMEMTSLAFINGLESSGGGEDEGEAVTAGEEVEA